MPLNSALINHSCGPNVEVGLYCDPNTPRFSNLCDKDFKTEVRAVKDISKGEEITKCYLNSRDILNFGFNRLARKMRIQEVLGFDCMCSVCSGGPGSFVDQEDILKQMLELAKKLGPNHYQKKKVDWEREAQIYQRMAELTEELLIGTVMFYRMNLLSGVAASAHLARDEELLGKAMDSLKNVVEESKMVNKSLEFDRFMYDTTNWSSQLKSKKLPKKEEIDAFQCHLSGYLFI